MKMNELIEIIKEEIANAVKEVKILQDPLGDVPVDYRHGTSSEEEADLEKIQNIRKIAEKVSKRFPGVTPELVSDDNSALIFHLKDFDEFLKTSFSGMPIESVGIDEEGGDYSLIVNFSQLEETKKPSAGMTKKEKSELVKKAKAGEDIGKAGKGFEKVKKAAEKGGAEDPEAVAAAAMWKQAAKKAGK